MNGSDNPLKHCISFTNNSNSQNKKITDSIQNLNIDIIKTDTIPMCSECLYEFEDGLYICTTCKINLCENHLKDHYQKFFQDNNSLIQNHHVFFKLEV